MTSRLKATTEKEMAPPVEPLATITPSDVRRLLCETAVAIVNGDIAPAEAELIVRDCRRITRELNRHARLVARMASAVCKVS